MRDIPAKYPTRTDEVGVERYEVTARGAVAVKSRMASSVRFGWLIRIHE